MSIRPPVYMVAAENGALPGGKAGGVGDVLRDLPPAIAETGRPVTILMPSYNRLHSSDGMEWCGEFPVRFGQESLNIEWYGKQTAADVDTVVLHHPKFDPYGTGQIYCDDGPDNPFATDATKFALLSLAAGEWLVRHADDQAVLHLHDWHAGLLALLRERLPSFERLKHLRCVLTLHNLALQGLRPRRGHPSSFERWFPELDPDDPLLSDPRYADVANPLAAAIRSVDHINTVSPTNAREILQPTDHARGFHGGEGLEVLLQHAAADGRLHGILNGCDYTAIPQHRPTFSDLTDTVAATLTEWSDQQPHNRSLFTLASRSLNQARHKQPSIILTAVSRLTDQKAGLLLARTQGITLLQQLLRSLPSDAVLLLLGSGDPGIETALAQHAATDPRLVFLRGFSEPLANAVFAAGDLFLMPSTFEPCGISQMYAMRAGQPCLVHAVGGLNDTVKDNINGFSFSGPNPEAQVANCMASMIHAQQVFFDQPERWQEIVDEARAARFLWSDAAAQYEAKMYV